MNFIQSIVSPKSPEEEEEKDENAVSSTTTDDIASTTTTESPSYLCIGMIGGGTVGGGVYQLIQSSPRLSSCCRITKICVQNLHKSRDFEIDFETTKLTNNVHDILDDATIDVIVEVVGGSDGIAKESIWSALQKGKSVVTANKALIAQHLQELQDILNEPNNKDNKNPHLLYEAAVCGGIPIIHMLQTCYYPMDTIFSIQGICNGTTNYMLYQMQDGQKDYVGALQEAQGLGYAEADPTADVEGYDVQAKMSILTKLAFGKTIIPSTTAGTAESSSLDESIARQGISQILPIDFIMAKECFHGNDGATIRLLGTAKSINQKKVLQVYVAPHIVPPSHDFASVITNGNAVQITSANMGATTYKGPGAGRFATANSVVSDLYRLATGTSIHPPFPMPDNNNDDKAWKLDTNYSSVFYIRWSSTHGQEEDDHIMDMAQALDLEIDRLLPVPTSTTTTHENNNTWHALLTQPNTTRSKMDALCEKIIQHDTATTSSGDSGSGSISSTSGCRRPFYMPVLSSQ